MRTFLVLVEGILFSRRGDRPILEGMQMVHALGSYNRLVLATEGTKEALERTLRLSPLPEVIADIFDSTSELQPLPLWQRQIEQARVATALMVVSDTPEIVEWCLAQGVPSLLFCHPGTSGPARRAQRGNAKWGSLIEELAARR